MRGGPTSTVRELLVRLVSTDKVETSERPDNPFGVESAVDIELTASYHDLRLTEVEDGREQEFVALAAAHAFETYAPLDARSKDLQGLGDLYNATDLAMTFYTSCRVALWEGAADEDSVYEARMASLERFFRALMARNFVRWSASTLEQCLAQLFGQQHASAMGSPENYFANADPADQLSEEVTSNPILFDLFSRLTVDEPHDLTCDGNLRNAFQHAVTHIAFETINSSHKEPLESFGPDVPPISPETMTRIINRVVSRYAGKLWPAVDVTNPLPGWLGIALQEYIQALMEITAYRANTGETALWVFDNILRVNQEELQGRFASLEDATVEDDGGSADDGLECKMKYLAVFEICSTPFATEADLERHMIEMHEVGPEDARDYVREASITLRQRNSCKS